MSITLSTAIYLLVHAVATVGAIIVFLLRTEQRITRLETSLSNLQQQHNIITQFGLKQHPGPCKKPQHTNQTE